MSHDHHHHDSSGHTSGASFAIAVGLNLTFVVVEVIAGVLSGSLALVADAGHNLSDVLGVALAWGASALVRRKASPRRTYGFRRITILSALVNGALLFVTTGGVLWEAIRRFGDPPAVAGTTVIVVALLGTVINGASALLFRRDHDLNVRGAYMHLMADAAVSLGVVVAGIVMSSTGWKWLDPAVSVVVSGVVLVGTWPLLRKATHLALDGVPDEIEPEKVLQSLRETKGVGEVHDLHIWALSTTEVALTAHIVELPGTDDALLLRRITDVVRSRFKIHHVTIQIEQPTDTDACEGCPPPDEGHAGAAPPRR